jgi:hypothetical protein
MWTRKLAVIGGTTDPDDWSILWDGKPVGRVFYDPRSSMSDEDWCWGVNGHAIHGRTCTMEEALARLRYAVLDLHGAPRPPKKPRSPV